jgi:LysM repeat protein
MNDTIAIVDKPLGTRFVAPRRTGGYTSSADFVAALANAQEASRPIDDRSVGAGGSKHLVQAGETLYGIAKARLALAGQAATPGASMRYALEIAKTNQIRNPDRIYAGQKLEVSAPAATVISTNHATVEAGRRAAYSDAAGTDILHEPDSQHATSAADLMDEVAESGTVGENKIAPIYGQPTIPASAAAGDIAAEDGVRSSPDSVERARAGLALYQQAAPAAAPKPPSEVPDMVYKGVVGKALDMVPLEPSTRTGLQQASAVISNAFAGRSLAALTGFGGPLLTIAGLLWGVFSAQKISAEQSGASNQLAQNTRAAPID